jgi:hypothetical protein
MSIWSILKTLADKVLTEEMGYQLGCALRQSLIDTDSGAPSAPPDPAEASFNKVMEDNADFFQDYEEHDS